MERGKQETETRKRGEGTKRKTISIKHTKTYSQKGEEQYHVIKTINRKPSSKVDEVGR